MTTASYVEPADDQYLEMAQTRSEIMRARGYGDDSSPPVEQPKRVNRKDYGRYRTPRPKVTSMPTLNGTTPSAPSLPPNGGIPLPQASDSSRLVSVVQQLTAVGLNVSMQLDGVPISVHA